MPDSAADLRHVDAWIFDLDNTLYRSSEAMLVQTDELMGSFIARFLNVDRTEARRVQKAYFRAHGLTLRGLMVEHGLDPEDYMRHLAQLDISDIEPDPELGAAIARLPGRKFVHTNAFSLHAARVLKRLGLTGHFDAVFDIGDADYVPKPAIAPYRRLCERHGVDPRRAIMIEDIARNLEPAATLGMTTVWLRTGASWAGDEPGGADHVVDDLKAWLKSVRLTGT